MRRVVQYQRARREKMRRRLRIIDISRRSHHLADTGRQSSRAGVMSAGALIVKTSAS